MIKTSMIALIAVMGLAGAASAAPVASETVSFASITSGQSLIVARHGADDPKGDDRGGKGRGKDDGAGHASLENANTLIQLAKNGADDGADHKRGGGKDDGVGHG